MPHSVTCFNAGRCDLGREIQGCQMCAFSCYLYKVINLSEEIHPCEKTLAVFSPHPCVFCASRTWHWNNYVRCIFVIAKHLFYNVFAEISFTLNACKSLLRWMLVNLAIQLFCRMFIFIHMHEWLFMFCIVVHLYKYGKMENINNQCWHVLHWQEACLIEGGLGCFLYEDWQMTGTCSALCRDD
jgi:hypothetical protein